MLEQRFERGAAGVRVQSREVAQPLLADAAGAEKRAANHGPAGLQDPRITLRERATGEVTRGGGKLPGVANAQICAEQLDLFQLARRRGDPLAQLREHRELE